MEQTKTANNLDLMLYCKGATATKLAEMTGITYDTISRVRRGEQPPRLDEMRAIADALGYPPEVWFKEPDEVFALRLLLELELVA